MHLLQKPMYGSSSIITRASNKTMITTGANLLVDPIPILWFGNKIIL